MDELSGLQTDWHRYTLRHMVSRDEQRIGILSDRIGWKFRSPRWAMEALTHRSSGDHHNERLEFLGDSVLNLVVARMLFEAHPDFDEGALSRVRSGMVNRDSLHLVANELQLGELMRMGEGELRSGGAFRPSILADALEAVLGAVFCDGGFEAAEGVIRKVFSSSSNKTTLQSVAEKDAKTRLQEWLQAKRLPLPVYRLVEISGEDHDRTFRVSCKVETPAIVTQQGIGKTRRSAEQQAAEQVLASLNDGESI